MFKLSKRVKVIVNYVLSPVLFVVLTASIYNKVTHQENLQASLGIIKNAFNGTNAWIMGLVLFLTIINWGIEARKWQIIVRTVQPIGLFTAFKSVLTGLAMSLFIPSRLGEYVGRVFYMQEGNRLRSVPFTVVAGLAQMIVTLSAGVAGLVYIRSTILQRQPLLQGLNDIWLVGFMYVISFIVLVFVLIYYRLAWLSKLLRNIPLVAKYSYFIESIETFHWKALTRILSLSAGRFLVFILQYLLILHVFKVEVSMLQGACMVSVLFLVLAVLPTIPIAELGLRGQASIQLFGLISANTVGIVATSSGIWLINLIVPAIAGSLFILGVKIFRKQDETDV